MVEHIQAEGPAPDDEEEISDSPDSSGVPAPGRYAVHERISSDGEVQKHMLAMSLEGASYEDIAESLSEFGIDASKGRIAAQRSNLDIWRTQYDDEALRSHREKARAFIIEHKPESAWRLLPECRALMAHLLTSTEQSSTHLANIMERFIKTISPTLKTFDYETLNDMLRRPDMSRARLAEYLLDHPASVRDDLFIRMRGVATLESEKETSLERFKNDWIFDDAARALLVALLDLGEDEVSQTAIAEIMSAAVHDVVSLSMVHGNINHYGGGYKAFADAIRVGTEAMTPGLHSRAKSLVEAHEREKRMSAMPRWMQSEEARALGCVLLRDPMISYEIASWALTAFYKDPATQVRMTALKEYVRINGQREAVQKMLRDSVSDEAFEKMGDLDLRTLEDFAVLPPALRRTIEISMLERFEPLIRLAGAIKKRAPSPVPQVYLTYGARAVVPKGVAAGGASLPQGIRSQPYVRIEFTPVTNTGTASERERSQKAVRDIQRLRESLVEELTYLRSSPVDRRYSTLLQSLIVSDKDPDEGPIKHVELKWREREDGRTKGELVDKVQSFELDDAFIRRLAKAWKSK